MIWNVWYRYQGDTEYTWHGHYDREEHALLDAKALMLFGKVYDVRVTL